MKKNYKTPTFESIKKNEANLVFFASAGGDSVKAKLGTMSTNTLSW